jgi:hypothetical protein
MIKFKQIDSGEIHALSYKEVIKLFFESEISRENRNLVVNVMLFLEAYASENQITFHLINENDWSRLIHIASNFQEEKSKRLNFQPNS